MPGSTQDILLSRENVGQIDNLFYLTMNTPQITRWAGSTAPTESTLTKLCEEQGLHPYQWSNGPHDTYAAHSHSYDKVIYVVRGSITFGLPDLGQSLELNTGDRLDLPAGVVHNAQVGAQGVVCLEARGKSIQGNT